MFFSVNRPNLNQKNCDLKKSKMNNVDCKIFTQIKNAPNFRAKYFGNCV